MSQRLGRAAGGVCAWASSPHPIFPTGTPHSGQTPEAFPVRAIACSARRAFPPSPGTPGEGSCRTRATAPRAVHSPPMRRKLFTLAAGVSAVLCVGVCLLWAWSADEVFVFGGTSRCYGIYSIGGSVCGGTYWERSGRYPLRPGIYVGGDAGFGLG